MILSKLITENSVEHDLGCFFSYQPYIPRKRKKTKQTSKGSFTQYSEPLFLHGLEYIEFSYEGISVEKVNELTELYELNELFTFMGAYNEEYTVDFCEWMPKAKRGFFTATGKFRIVCVETGFSPTCQENN